MRRAATILVLLLLLPLAKAQLPITFESQEPNLYEEQRRIIESYPLPEGAKLMALSEDHLADILSVPKQERDLFMDLPLSRFRVMALFYSSLPLFSQLSVEKRETLARMTRADILRLSQLPLSDLDSYLSRVAIVAVKAVHLYKQRDLPDSDFRTGRKEYRTALSSYEAAKAGLEKNLRAYQRSTTDLAACDGDCEEFTTTVRNNARAIASERIAMEQAYLQMAQGRVQMNDDLSWEEAALIASELQAHADELSHLEVEGWAGKPDDLLSLVDSATASIHFSVRVAVAKSALTSLKELVDRMRNAERRTDCVLASVEQEGGDTGMLDVYLDDMSGSAMTAASILAQAGESLGQAGEFDVRDPMDRLRGDMILDEALDQLEDARQHLEQAQRLLMRVVRDIHLKGFEVSVCVSSDEYLKPDEDYLDIRCSEGAVPVTISAGNVRCVEVTTDAEAAYQAASEKVQTNLEYFEKNRECGLFPPLIDAPAVLRSSKTQLSPSELESSIKAMTNRPADEDRAISSALLSEVARELISINEKYALGAGYWSEYSACP